MATFEIKFNKRTLEAIVPPTKGYDIYYDTETAALAMRVMAGGTKTFIVYRKVNGRPVRVTIGRFPDVTIDVAQNEASEIKTQLRKGEDPNAKKKALRHGTTFEELFTQYLEQHAKKHKKTWQEDENTYHRYLTGFSKKPLALITKADIERLHTKMGNENGKYAANRTLALLSSVFNKAIDWKWEGTNPTLGIKKFKEKSRQRFLDRDELPRFFEALAEMPNENARDYILVSLLTGARKTNVLSMQWDNVNLETGVWHIPTTKNDEPHSVPLVDSLVDLLRNRKKKYPGRFVFPSETSRSGHFMEPKTTWNTLLKRANLKDVRLHDLRRTLGSWQAATGANLSVIGKTLAHKNVSTTAIYARLNLDPVRESLKTATNAMLQFYPQSTQHKKLGEK
jgi:integrase